jgi:uncharacterized protein (DUF983 family)
MTDLVPCPACEGWGHIHEGKTGTTRCEVCKGAGEVEMRVDDAPPVLLGILLAVVVIIVGYLVIMLTEVLEAAP